jgi:large subunit ribosomal protein L17
MNFAVAVIKHERVTTTLAKAKAMRGFVEKLITLARKDDPATRLHRIRQAATVLQDKTAVKKLFDEIGPRFANRPGGYIRVLRLPDHRIGDGSSKAIFELVENNVLEMKIKAAEEAEAAVDETETEDAGV